jgi:hypothetical protein
LHGTACHPWAPDNHDFLLFQLLDNDAGHKEISWWTSDGPCSWASPHFDGLIGIDSSHGLNVLNW